MRIASSRTYSFRTLGIVPIVNGVALGMVLGFGLINTLTPGGADEDDVYAWQVLLFMIVQLGTMILTTALCERREVVKFCREGIDSRRFGLIAFDQISAYAIDRSTTPPTLRLEVGSRCIRYGHDLVGHDLQPYTDFIAEFERWLADKTGGRMPRARTPLRAKTRKRARK